MKIRGIHPADRSWIEQVISKHFVTPQLVSRGVAHDSKSLPGLVAELDGTRAGLLLYRIHKNQCEVVAVVSVVQRRGIGRALLDAIQSIAREAACKRLWLITTNDNRDAIGFYEALGWRKVAVHRGGVNKSRQLKPEIPKYGSDGTPIEDEIEFEFPSKP